MKTQIVKQRQNVDDISEWAASGRSIVLYGATGTGRRTLVRTALAGYQLEWYDCWSVCSWHDLNRFAGGDLRDRVRVLDQQAKEGTKVCLVLANIDGCGGFPDESNTIGWLRSFLQGCQYLPVVQTVASEAFLLKHYVAYSSAFFKQTIIREILPPTFDELPAWAEQAIGVQLDGLAHRQIAEWIGLLPANLTPFFEALIELRSPEDTQPVNAEQVVAARKAIVQSRVGMYQALCANQLTPRQRRLLHAIAKGDAVNLSKAASAACGIPQHSMGAVFRSLHQAGWIEETADDWQIRDPYLECFLASL
jgi:hypothetical protein